MRFDLIRNTCVSKLQLAEVSTIVLVKPVISRRLEMPALRFSHSAGFAMGMSMMTMERML